MERRAEVRIIDHQKEEIVQTDVTGSEADYLLSKYGYNTIQNNPIENIPYDPNSNLTADQMWEMQEREMRENDRREHQKRNGPRSMTFDSNNIQYSNTEYRDIEDGFGISVQIVSDMPLFNRR